MYDIDERRLIFVLNSKTDALLAEEMLYPRKEILALEYDGMRSYGKYAKNKEKRRYERDLEREIEL